MKKAIASTLTALMLSVFMIKDRTWSDAGALIMNGVIWGLSAFLWMRWLREKQA